MKVAERQSVMPRRPRLRPNSDRADKAAPSRVSRDAAVPSTFPLALADLTLDLSSPLPIHEQICQSVRTAIWAEDLPSGTLLPTSRELAEHLGVARNTVVFSYARLVAEGLCVSNTRRGTRVAADFPSRSRDPARPRPSEAAAGCAPLRTAFHARNALELRIERAPGGVPFVLNASDPALYPRTKLGRRLADKFLSAPSKHPASARPANETGGLQSRLAVYLRRARGVVCSPSQIIVVPGLESALDLTTRVLLDPGDMVQLQNPSMDVVQSAFLAARAHLQAIPCDANGADIGRVEGPPARLIFVSPSVSYPFGAQMSEARRRDILSAAHAQNAIVFENDMFCELRYSGARLRAIQGMDGEDRVIYYGGFAETLGNSVNVGYLVVPNSLVDAFVEVSLRLSNAPPPQVQDALAEFLDEHEYAMHARTVRSVFARRLEIVKEACRTHLPRVVTSEPHGGLFLVLQFGDAFDEVAIWEAAAADGIPVSPLSHYNLRRGAARGLVFGFGALPERAIDPAIRQLAAILSEREPPRLERISA